MGRGLHRTDIEILMANGLEKKHIDFVEQFPIRCKYGYIADFYLPNSKIIVECDGEYYHKKGNDKDRKRDGFLKKQGYKILRFRGNDIRNNLDSCINKIMEEI